MKKETKIWRLLQEEDRYFYVMEIIRCFAFVMWLGFIPVYPEPLKSISFVAIAVFLLAFLAKAIKVFRKKG